MKKKIFNLIILLLLIYAYNLNGISFEKEEITFKGIIKKNKIIIKFNGEDRIFKKMK